MIFNKMKKKVFTDESVVRLIVKNVNQKNKKIFKSGINDYKENVRNEQQNN